MAVLAPPAAPASGKTQGPAAAVAANPFTKAARQKVEPFFDSTFTLGASSQTIQQVDVPATGYLRHVVIDVTGSGTTGAVYVADAPWSVFDQVQLTDVNGQPIVILNGYELFLANLLGAYAQRGGPLKNPNYASSATGFKFQLRVPVEIVQRNALGALANMNSAMTYKLKMTLAPAAAVYSAGSAANSVRVTAIVESWSNPNPSDLRGVPNVTTPPALGTTQNWSDYTAPITVGNNTVRLPRVGNTIRNLIFVYRDVAGVRQNTGLPTELAKFVDGNQWTRNSFAYEQQRLGELYGFAASELPAGVWSVCLTNDFDGTPGEEIGDYWLNTTGATRLEVQGVFTVAGSLAVITNDILAYAGSGGAGQTLG